MVSVREGSQTIEVLNTLYVMALMKDDDDLQAATSIELQNVNTKVEGNSQLIYCFIKFTNPL